MSLVKVIVLCVLVVGVMNSKNDQGKVRVAVYYESLCPDSERFVKNQLLPQVQSHKDRIKVILIPFGKAYSVGANGFRCQHGPNECAGNMFQDCALYLMRNHTDVEKVKYVDCELTTLAGVHESFRCVDDVPHLSATAVLACIKGQMGIYLQRQSEIATFQVQKPLDFVPTITIDGVFNQHLQDLAFNSLHTVLAQKIKYNSSMVNHFNLL